MAVYPINRRIATRYEAIADVYPQTATMQQDIALHLATMLSERCHDAECILDVGAGPGFAGLKLRDYYPTADLVWCDLAKHNITQAADYLPLQADFAKLPIDNNRIDAVFASMALHWSQSLATTLLEWQRVLKPGGWLAIAIPLEGSLNEFKIAGLNINTFPNATQLADKLTNATITIQTHQQTGKSLSDLITCFKATGGNTCVKPTQRGLRGKTFWLNAQKNFPRSEATPYYRLTYRIGYILWQKH